MLIALVGIALLLILLLIAVRIGIKKEKVESETLSPLIHASGIYSIVRKSPRESIGDFKPSQEEIIKYLSNKNVNMGGLQISDLHAAALLKSWNTQMEANIDEIENGDSKGIEFYYYEFAWDDPICQKFIVKGRFVTRQELFRFPIVIPPFHIGCGCNLKKYESKEKLHDTTEIGMLPLFENNALPKLPEWKEILLGPTEQNGKK